MAISEIERNHLHNRLNQVLGEEDAAVLMSHLPPSGWSDVVRTSDLDNRLKLLEAQISARLAEQDTRIVARLAALGGLLLVADQILSRL